MRYALLALLFTACCTVRPSGELDACLCTIEVCHTTEAGDSCMKITRACMEAEITFCLRKAGRAPNMTPLPPPDETPEIPRKTD